MTEEEFLDKLQFSEVVWFAAEKREEGAYLLFDMCCHYRLSDGKYFSGKLKLSGDKRDQIAFLKKAAEIIKQHWQTIFDESLSDAIDNLKGD